MASPSQQFLVNQGEKMTHEIQRVLDQVSLDMERIDIGAMFENNEELAVALVEQFAGIFHGLMASRLATMSAVVASGFNPETGQPLTEEDGYMIQVESGVTAPPTGDSTDPRGEGPDTLDIPDDLSGL